MRVEHSLSNSIYARMRNKVQCRTTCSRTEQDRVNRRNQASRAPRNRSCCCTKTLDDREPRCQIYARCRSNGRPLAPHPATALCPSEKLPDRRASFDSTGCSQSPRTTCGAWRRSFSNHAEASPRRFCYCMTNANPCHTHTHEFIALIDEFAHNVITNANTVEKDCQRVWEQIDPPQSTSKGIFSSPSSPLVLLSPCCARSSLTRQQFAVLRTDLLTHPRNKHDNFNTNKTHHSDPMHARPGTSPYPHARLSKACLPRTQSLASKLLPCRMRRSPANELSLAAQPVCVAHRNRATRRVRRRTATLPSFGNVPLLKKHARDKSAAAVKGRGACKRARLFNATRHYCMSMRHPREHLRECISPPINWLSSSEPTLTSVRLVTWHPSPSR